MGGVAGGGVAEERFGLVGGLVGWWCGKGWRYLVGGLESGADVGQALDGAAFAEAFGDGYVCVLLDSFGEGEMLGVC